MQHLEIKAAFVNITCIIYPFYKVLWSEKCIECIINYDLFYWFQM